MMTTKPPSPVQEFPPDSLEKVAYEAVAGIPTQEPNDQHRLGYQVWIWLKERKGTLEDVVKISGCRTTLGVPEIVSEIRQRLEAKGVSVR